MPIYAYRCTTCGHAKDVLQKMSDPLLSVCPACGASTFVKQVTAAGFQLKGSGWYVTDFRGGDASKGGDADKKGDAAKGAPPAPNGDAAPATPAAAAPAASSTPAPAPAAAPTPAAPAPSTK